VSPEDACDPAGVLDGFLAFFNGVPPFLKKAFEGTSRCFSELFFTGLLFGFDLLIRLPPPEGGTDFGFPLREEESLFRGIGIF
jgi:hypothetical protein